MGLLQESLRRYCLILREHETSSSQAETSGRRDMDLPASREERERFGTCSVNRVLRKALFKGHGVCLLAEPSKSEAERVTSETHESIPLICFFAILFCRDVRDVGGSYGRSI